MKLPDDLYPYQKDDLTRLTSNGDNLLNLSEMGTGKTPVALGLSQHYKKTLVVCPNTLKLEWARQIQDWMGFDPTVSSKSSSRRLDPLLDDAQDDIFTDKTHPFFITNYETLRTKRWQDILNEYPFDLLILDEAHKIRNPKTRICKAVFSFIEEHPDIRIMPMTGSPIVNNPADLFTLLCIVKPDDYKLRNRWDFIREYCYYWQGRYGLKVYGSRDLNILRAETAYFTIRHTKQEVLPYLPSKYYRRVLLEMGTKQREAYNQMEEELFVLLDSGEPLWAGSVLAQITRLRQLNTDPRIVGVDAPSIKTDFLLSLLEDTDEKVVVFSCFEKYISLLDRLISTPHITITGKVSPDDRMKAVKEFQTNPDIKYALGTTQCMGEGITLTKASNAVVVDRWWNPSVNEQAEDRLHRIGQDNAVQIITPVNEKSFDSSLDKILEKKGKYSKDYLQDKDVISETIEDLRANRGG